MGRIDQYPECTTPVDNDLLLIETEEGTKKVKKSTLLKAVVDLLGDKDISSIGDGTVTGAITDLNNDLNKDWTVALPMSNTATRTYTIPSDAKEVMIFASFSNTLVGSSDVYPISFVKSFNPGKVTSMYTSGGGSIFYCNLGINSNNVATLIAASNSYCALLYR